MTAGIKCERYWYHNFRNLSASTTMGNLPTATTNGIWCQEWKFDRWGMHTERAVKVRTLRCVLAENSGVTAPVSLMLRQVWPGCRSEQYRKQSCNVKRDNRGTEEKTRLEGLADVQICMRSYGTLWPRLLWTWTEQYLQKLLTFTFRSREKCAYCHGYVLREDGTHCIAHIVPCKM
jgi:hypothetical protein